MLEVLNMTKLYPGVKALDKVKLSVKPGTVHGLMGENGAGKSTLMKILAGTIKPSEGLIKIDNKEVVIEGVDHSRKLGIGIVYQELSLFNNLTVAQNLFIMQEPEKKGLILDKKMIEESKALLSKYELTIDPSQMVNNLSISEKQLIEIIKAIRTNPKILILDEPTSSLSEEEVKLLFKIIKKMKDKGCAIIYISHKMNEIFQICDEITVFRDGQYMGSDLSQNFDQNSLVKMMIGRDLTQAFPQKINVSQKEDMLDVKNISHLPYYRDISFKVKKGEILGFYGLVGSGRTEIMKGLFGIYPSQKGEIYLNNKKTKIDTPLSAIKSGLAFVTENRKEEGLILGATIEENISMVRIDHIIKKGFLNSQKEEKIAVNHIKNLKIKTPSSKQIVNNLSGGNQQKVVLAKWFEHNPNVFIFDEPTRGIDVGAKYEIYQVIQNLVKEGVAVIVISSELPEIMNLCNTIALVKDNTIIHNSPVSEITENEIILKLTEQ